MTLTVDEIEIADPPEAWSRAGFSVDSPGDSAPVCRVGGVRLRLVGRDHGSGIVGWSLRGLPQSYEWPGDLDGIPTTSSDSDPSAPAEHANGVVGIDHVVVFSPDTDRTVASLGGIGAQPRRERRGELGGRPIRQIFFRFGEVIIEVVGAPENPDDGPAILWGITYTVANIDMTAEFFGERTAPVKPAVQPGRRITTLRYHDLGISVRSAMISAAAPPR